MLAVGDALAFALRYAHDNALVFGLRRDVEIQQVGKVVFDALVVGAQRQQDLA